MDETLKLILRAHEGDKTARDQLVMDNVGLIWSIVRRFAGRGYEMEDLFQIGSIGPVSYTHLDVYKRQALAQLDQIQRELGEAISGQDGAYPVSYTHLDVYKRQLLIFLPRPCYN